MVTEQQVRYLDYLKETYGQDLKGHMIANMGQMSQITAQESLLGLAPQQDPKFYDEFKKIGGDSEYLKFAIKCFLEVRKDVFGR